MSFVIALHGHCTHIFKEKLMLSENGSAGISLCSCLISRASPQWSLNSSPWHLASSVGAC